MFAFFCMLCLVPRKLILDCDCTSCVEVNGRCWFHNCVHGVRILYELRVPNVRTKNAKHANTVFMRFYCGIARWKIEIYLNYEFVRNIILFELMSIDSSRVVR